MDPNLKSALIDLLGPKGWTEDPDLIAPKLADWRGNFQGSAQFMARPASTEETAELVKLCAQYDQPICPQGGNTGLVNGGIPYDELLLSMERMNTVREVNPFNNSLTAEAGCILEHIQNTADDAGRYFPLSLGSQGNCTIGGLISTNAGGVAVLRYGMMRDLLLGIEVVTPQGDVVSTLHGLRKDNTGYDLKHLFAGAEGTLGVVTAACLKLFPIPKTATAWLTLDSVQKAVKLLALARDIAGDTVTGFEFLPRGGTELTAKEIDGARDPLPSELPWRVLIEISMSSDELAADMLSKILETAIESGLVENGVVANSKAQADSFWLVRESLPLVKRAFLTSVAHDVSVPVSKVPEFLDIAGAAMKEIIPHVEIFAFGHLGDGNIHYSVAEANDDENPQVRAKKTEISQSVHAIATEFGGSISAEHGIGLLKVDELAAFKSSAEIEIMRGIKAALDPKNIMNPGRIFR